MSARRISPLALAALLPCAAAVALLRAAAPGASWAHLSQRRPSPLALPDPDLPKEPVRPVAAALPKSAGPPFALDCGDVGLVLDGFGGFGSASFGGDAQYFNGSQEAPTVFESMMHLRGASFLDAESLMLPQSDSGAHLDGDAVIASYRRGPLRFDLRSQLVECGPAAGVLEQRWTITHVATNPVVIVLTQYFDGDLWFSGGFGNDFAVMTDDALYQFDVGAGAAPSAYVAVTSEAPLAVTTLREVGEYPDQRRRINRGELLHGGLLRATGATADADGDGVTDGGFDASLAVQHQFGTLAPGAVREIVTRIRWGVGRLGDVAGGEVTVDAGPDRVVECEGQDGTVVAVAATATDPSRIATWSWSVDGAAAGSGAEVELLLDPGPHVVDLVAEDLDGERLADQVLIDVVDSTPPRLDAAPRVELWPPDHRMVVVPLAVSAFDACSSVDVVALSVSSNEPPDVRHGGDGRTAQDCWVAGGVVHVRRERQGDGSDRIYRVEAEARDAAGNSTPLVLEIVVPHDRSD